MRRADSRRQPAAAEPAQHPADPDVGRDHAQRAAGARQLDVVDPNDLAAVDVDDLLVEQILDQVQRFVFRRDVGGRRFPQHHAPVVVELEDVLDRGDVFAAPGFDDDCIDVRKRVGGAAYHEVGDPPDDLTFTSASHDGRPAEHFREEAFVERHGAIATDPFARQLQRVQRAPAGRRRRKRPASDRAGREIDRCVDRAALRARERSPATRTRRDRARGR